MKVIFFILLIMMNFTVENREIRYSLTFIDSEYFLIFQSTMSLLKTSNVNEIETFYKKLFNSLPDDPQYDIFLSEEDIKIDLAALRISRNNLKSILDKIDAGINFYPPTELIFNFLCKQEESISWYGINNFLLTENISNKYLTPVVDALYSGEYEKFDAGVNFLTKDDDLNKVFFFGDDSFILKKSFLSDIIHHLESKLSNEPNEKIEKLQDLLSKAIYDNDCFVIITEHL
jgi:hypothetical protein